MLNILLALFFQAAPAPDPALAEAGKQFRALTREWPRLPLRLAELPVAAELEMVSSAAVGKQGLIYLLQRGSKADPVIVVNQDGRILRSWGKGLYQIPHSIRIDDEGNIWTADAASSVVYRFSPEGKQLLKIEVGGLPAAHRSEFRGTTDIAFAPGGRVFISDGYANARILEYTKEGKRVREWGTAGTGPGQFHLPHGLTIDREGILYVADRENGRIQRFHLDGRYIGEWTHLGKTFSITATPAGDMWIGTQPRDVGNGVEAWLVKIDRRSGKVLGCVESKGHHSVDVTAAGEPITGARPDKVLRFSRLAARR